MGAAERYYAVVTATGIVFAAVAFAPIVSLSSCAPASELTRSRAKALLESTKEFNELMPADLYMDGWDIQKGIKLGYWTERLDHRSFELTPSGKTLFAPDRGALGTGDPTFITVAKTKRQLRAVTDIRNAPASNDKATQKIVEFMWFWDLDRLPGGVRDFLGTHIDPAEHKAIFRAFSDGWHVERFDPEFRSAERSTEVVRP